MLMLQSDYDKYSEVLDLIFPHRKTEPAQRLAGQVRGQVLHCWQHTIIRAPQSCCLSTFSCCLQPAHPAEAVS
jgi:hypothetical protein